jgi:hypothetical protein
MKAKILVGAIAAFIYGGTALAQDQANTGGQDKGQQNPGDIGGSGMDNDASDLIILDQEDVAPVTPDTGVDQGVGGAGLQGQDYGGSGQVGQSTPQVRPGIPMQGQGGVTLYCTPVNQAAGGSGDVGILPGNEQSSLPGEHDVQVGQVDVNDDAFGGAGYEAKDEDKANMRGLTVMLGGGVEGYTGALAPEINPGPSAGVTASIRPSKTFGLELCYSGAINNLDRDVGGTGPDIVRNGAQAAVTLGLSAAPVQPYVLGGFGMNWYNVRNGQSLGFRDDTSSKIPVGVGLRTHIGSLTADARVNYNVLLSEDFVPRVANDEITTGSYNGTINLGGTF